ncbi:MULTISPECIES: nuclear transport factor 2 family protein [Haloferax]|uniref:Nuclear transport factor 2 family protein n=1 Tax=Haloferax marinum TaxID=2666143 RepID=A0A6A8G7W5_9EURY|nr:MULTISPECIES: nuclear transport factor 2 family protein [Haloferax]KAB1198093.1 nuclear transport factor 2 family protein [Haloferax sp. CBA1150]MRW97164.1 nuclear transport factor 2 family protein [Haloferax marinum]
MDSPRVIVEAFFDRMEDDRRDTVGDLFAEDATITLPGATFEGPTAAYDFLDFLAPRYEWAAKEFDRWIEAGDTVVSIGRLYGVDNDGIEFEDVRYVDVYEVRRGLIQRLDIWNDLAVDGVVPVEPPATADSTVAGASSEEE